MAGVDSLKDAWETKNVSSLNVVADCNLEAVAFTVQIIDIDTSGLPARMFCDVKLALSVQSHEY